MDKYISYKDFEDVDKILEILPQKDEEYWIKGVENIAIDIANNIIKTIPAYHDFLQKNRCKLSHIENIAQFNQLPVMTKKNYLGKYGYEAVLCGKPEEVKTFFMSSGSTGEPTIWPRLPQADEAYSVFVNFYYNLFWQISKKKTLYISAMDLGIWASGNLQFNAAKYCSSRYPFTFANPGANLPYIYSILKKMAPYYDLVIIATYPSQARRIIEFIENNNLDLTTLPIKFMLGGEPHTIEWRHFILNRLGLGKDDLFGVMDYYGTSDSGGPGSSTPLTSLIQNLCAENHTLCNELFGQKTVPSLFQKNPTIHVESQNNNIIITYPGQIPLCRYDSGDTGGLILFSVMLKALKKYGYDIFSLLRQNHFQGKTWQWPFVYLTGRSDQAVNIGGALVYPKDIEGIFFQDDLKEISSFKIAAEVNRSNHQKFVVYLEITKGTAISQAKKEKIIETYKKRVFDRLSKVNPDYLAAFEMDKKSCEPKVIICKHGRGPFSGEELKHKPCFIVE